MTDGSENSGQSGLRDFGGIEIETSYGTTVTVALPSKTSELERLRCELFELIEEAQEEEDEFEDLILLGDEGSAKLMEFFTVSHAIIEDWSATVLEWHLLKSKHMSEPYSEKMFQKWMTQWRREELLEEAGLIDAGLKGEMKQVRDFRNELVHDYAERYTLQPVHQGKANVDRAIRIIEKLRQKGLETLTSDPTTETTFSQGTLGDFDGSDRKD